MFPLPYRGNGLVGVGVDLSFVDVLILQEVTVPRLFRIVPFFAAAAAAVALIFSAQVGAQLQSGPLWWVPDNDTDWSRHHDRWLVSPVEVVGVGAATAFPARTWVSSEQLGYLTTAPPNSACDYMNETECDVVGPPDLDRQDSMRTPRTPMHWGGAGGLQQSVHIGEYWQGRVMNDYMTHPSSSATHRALYPGFCGVVCKVLKIGLLSEHVA